MNRVTLVHRVELVCGAGAERERVPHEQRLTFWVIGAPVPVGAQRPDEDFVGVGVTMAKLKERRAAGLASQAAQLKSRRPAATSFSVLCASASVSHRVLLFHDAFFFLAGSGPSRASCAGRRLTEEQHGESDAHGLSVLQAVNMHTSTRGECKCVRTRAVIAGLVL